MIAIDGYNVAQIRLNSNGTYYGKIGNPSTQVWSLGWGTAESDINAVLNWTSTGRVGIGVPNPLYKLDVRGGELHIVNDQVNGYSFIARNANPGNNDSYLYHRMSANFHIMGSNKNGTGTLRKLGFAVGGTDTESDIKMIIDGTGNVGIGTSTLDSKLTVNGSLKVLDPTNWSIGFGVNNDPPRFLSVDVVNSAIDTDLLELVHTRGAGVNIGKTGDNKILNVYGKLKINDPTTPWDIGFGVGGDPSSHVTVDVVNSPIDTDLLELVHTRGAGVNIGKTGDNKILNVYGKLKINDPTMPWDIGFGVGGDPSSHVTVDVVNSPIDTDPLELVFSRGTGVVIGKSSANKFLKVFGTAYAHEVNVTLSIPGPDYVFESDYDLPTLAEIEAYIKVHKHLPEVPSAKQMEAEGMKLMEMNVLLLKKVEELTLHLIALKKETELQNKANEDLKKEISEIKTHIK